MDIKALFQLNTGLENVVPTNVQAYVDTHKADLRGDTGPQGPKGPKGDTGPQGPSGNPWGGGTFTGHVTISKDRNFRIGDWYFFQSTQEENMLHINNDDLNYVLLAGKNGGYICFAPYKAGVYSLGRPNNEWSVIYAKSSAIVTSDKNNKTDINDITDKYLQLFELLRPVTYRFIDGQSGRLHIGFIAQEVEAAMERVGLSSLDFAGFCKDKDKDGNYIYSLRYEEFIALNTAAIHRQQEKIASLEQRLERLEQQCVQ